jgi:hypothetical protein
MRLRIAVPSIILALISFSPIGTASAGSVPVACGDTIAGAGILTGDLNCFEPEYSPITITHGRLDLQGFTLQGGIVCMGTCKISNGTLAAAIVGEKSIGLRDVVKYGELITNGAFA